VWWGGGEQASNNSSKCESSISSRKWELEAQGCQVSSPSRLTKKQASSNSAAIEGPVCSVCVCGGGGEGGSCGGGGGVGWGDRQAATAAKVRVTAGVLVKCGQQQQQHSQQAAAKLPAVQPMTNVPCHPGHAWALRKHTPAPLPPHPPT
jgi:hypothetical protein